MALRYFPGRQAEQMFGFWWKDSASLTHRKKDRDDKRQSKVEIHSSEWPDYSSRSQPKRISCLLLYAIRS